MKDTKKLFLMLNSLYTMYRIVLKMKSRRRGNRRRWWVREINKNRDITGYYNVVFRNMKEQDPEQFFIHTRMRKPVYELLLSLLKSKLSKTSIRKAIDPECRLALTLSFLSQGTSHQFLAWSFQMGKSTVRKVILETCDAIWETLSPVYLSEPRQDDYAEIGKEFSELWNMPNCIGALDGKHITIKCPPNSGTQFFNYKHLFSIVLLATCDKKYKFTQVDVGAYGSQSDGGILRESEFGKYLLRKMLPIPEPIQLHNSNTVFPHYFVGDAAFPLKNNLMKPFPGKLLNRRKTIFNYRLPRARRVIENAFGILVARWRCLRTSLECSPSNAERITLATLALHNFIMHQDKFSYCSPTFVDWEDEEKVLHSGEWRKEIEGNDSNFRPLNVRYRNASVSAFNLRDTLADYFIGEGSVPFQEAI